MIEVYETYIRSGGWTRWSSRFVLNLSHVDKNREEMTDEMENTAAEVLIVGTGPTGLSLAITLRRFGIPVRIVDRDGPAELPSPRP